MDQLRAFVAQQPAREEAIEQLTCSIASAHDTLALLHTTHTAGPDQALARVGFCIRSLQQHGRRVTAAMTLCCTCCNTPCDTCSMQKAIVCVPRMMGVALSMCVCSAAVSARTVALGPWKPGPLWYMSPSFCMRVGMTVTAAFSQSVISAGSASVSSACRMVCTSVRAACPGTGGVRSTILRCNFTLSSCCTLPATTRNSRSYCLGRTKPRASRRDCNKRGVGVPLPRAVMI
mmetsp:Transcript_41774/g.70528  ORF Transcript_41774/g.70528 Transcript_41774/m.70528 type:complete len:232 (-) Transcript_41774:933-1628(-)